jgi:hypothetical protein
MKTKNQTHHAMRHALYTGLLAAGMLASGGSQAANLAVDLSDTSVTSGFIGGVEFIYDKFKASGTGNLDPFIRIQEPGNEQGYNTNVRNIFDDKSPVNYTHSLTYDALGQNNGYITFILDIAEGGNNPESLLSLDGLKIFAGQGLANESGVGLDAYGNWVGAGTKLWDMDAGGDQYVKLDDKRGGHPGNGWTDMLLKVPVSVFTNAGVQATDNIILWSRFGLQYAAEGKNGDNGLGSANSFEEWAYTKTSAPLPDCNDPEYAAAHPLECGDIPVPEPGILALIGLGMLTMAASYRRRVTIYSAVRLGYV